MSRRVVVIARTKPEGRAFAKRMTGKIAVVAIVTPRSPDAARGVLADAWYSTPGIFQHPRRDELIDSVLPCMDTSKPTDSTNGATT